MRRSRQALAVLVLVPLLAAGCGDGASNDVTSRDDTTTHDTSAGTAAASAASAADLRPRSNPGDPRDLVSLMNNGVAVTIAEYETYEQLRDYSDVSVIATVTDIRVTVPYVEPYALPGELEVDLAVEAVLGGRFTNTEPRSTLTMVLPMHATADILRDVRPRLARLEGTTRIAVFLRQLVEPARSRRLAPRYMPVLYGGPPAILAEWPGDGRFTELRAHDYLWRDAVARGEERTGVTQASTDAWSPTFPDTAPIGLTASEAADSFAVEPGEAQSSPPEGWDQLEPRLAPPP